MVSSVDLSIIIVNYKANSFLDLCLESVYRAINKLSVEIIVVDNASNDGHIKRIKSKYADIITIENKTNIGFSKANNQGINIANGIYVLFLNPDTVVQQNTFTACIGFFVNQKNVGAIGVKMIDTHGVFATESKRGLPTVWAATCYVLGIGKLFPKSHFFNQYHLNALAQESVHQIDIISGAYFFTTKKVLNEVGYFDEQFFMYGEDIDLAYRIKQAGYSNYYLSHTKIIHYKGECTKKQSFKYVYTFQYAMYKFAKKHFSIFHFTLSTVAIYANILVKCLILSVKKTAKLIIYKQRKINSYPASTLIIGNNEDITQTIKLISPRQDITNLLQLSYDLNLYQNVVAILKTQHVNSIVLCSSSITYEAIISLMMQLQFYKINFNIVSNNNSYMVVATLQ